MFYEALKSFRNIIRNKNISKISSISSKTARSLNGENKKSSPDLSEMNLETDSNDRTIKAYFK
jgi:hypothetical protein